MLDHEALRCWTFPDIVRTYSERDTMLYALGVGCGADSDDLRFVYEESLEAIPTMATVIADPGFWLADPKLGARIDRIVHGSQSVTLHAPLPTSAAVVGRTRIEKLLDKGKERGAYVHTTQTIEEKESGRLLATLTATIVLLSDGGFGGEDEPRRSRTAIPDRPCDATCAMPTLPQAALIYRLSGDMNPLHADPDIARGAGFPGPILHGLCSMGVAARAILRTCCDNDPKRLSEISVRFSAPVFPGETLRVDVWRAHNAASFRMTAAERGAVVLDGGWARIAP